MTMAYYSSDADLALLAPMDDTMAHLFPASACHSPPTLLYSSSLQHMSQPTPTTLPTNEAMFAYQHDYPPVLSSPYPPHAAWSAHSSPMVLPQASTYSYPPFTSMTTASTLAPESGYMSQPYGAPRPSRSQSVSSSIGLGLSSNAPSETSPPSVSRSLSPSSPDLLAYGFPNKNGTWSCSYPGCTSRAVFTRGCDLRKHHKRHTKSFFCHHADCPQSTGGGFSSKKDLARHEAKHNPGVLCDWDGCDRVFSRVDNMRDHVKRIHLKSSRKPLCS